MTTQLPDQPRSYRIHAAMVLFSLEEALGNFVVSSALDTTTIPQPLRLEIERRLESTGFVPVSQIVQETFLREVIELSVTVSKDRSEYEPLRRLRDLANSLDLFEIRNSVCHPNRPVPDFFWFRMAAIASDPCIEQARLGIVSDALRCALENRITSPPEGWLNQRTWSVPNSLPSTFDHQLTGLIARQSEAQDLRKLLKNLRNSLIAIVGPGGTGKTALCLDTLRESCQDPLTLNWAEQVVYVSAKTEKLTSTGIEPIEDPLTSLDSVKEAMVRTLYGNDEPLPSFEEIAEQMVSRKLLLCIDNLETLLRDHPEQFEEFVQTLPRDWRILVTSRVTVNGANVLSLHPIKREGAIKLARDYSSLRGIQRLDDQHLARLIEVCDRNPLAIRLVIDAFAAGSPLEDALKQTKEQITDFSYTALIEHLPQSSGKILETLFGANEPLSRAQICHFLDLSTDEVAEAVNSLLRTSLVTRVLDLSTESYALSSSVRDLLVRTPQDPSVRADVYKRLRDQKRISELIEKSGTKDPFDESFVPSHSPLHIKALLTKARPSVSGRASRAECTRILGEVQKVLSFESRSGAVYRTEALLLDALGDPYRAMDSLRRAVSCPEKDECAQLRLAELLRDEQQLGEAVEQTEPLVTGGFLTRSEVSIRNKARLFRAHYVSLLWLKRYEHILEITNAWRDKGELRPAHLALRISCIQRFIDDEVIVNEQAVRYVSEIIESLSEGFRLDGYLPDTVHEGFRALDRLYRMECRSQLTQDSLKDTSLFLDAHLPAMCGSSNEHSLSDDFIKELILRFRSQGGADNPLNADRWSDLVIFGEAEDKALANVGYISSRITKIKESYLFAQAIESAAAFFVHRAATELSPQKFNGLKEGQLLHILPSDALPEPGRARLAKHAMID